MDTAPYDLVFSVSVWHLDSMSDSHFREQVHATSEDSHALHAFNPIECINTLCFSMSDPRSSPPKADRFNRNLYSVPPPNNRPFPFTKEEDLVGSHPTFWMNYTIYSSTVNKSTIRTQITSTNRRPILTARIRAI